LVAAILLLIEAVSGEPGQQAKGPNVTAKSGTIIPSERAGDIVEKIKKYY